MSSTLLSWSFYLLLQLLESFLVILRIRNAQSSSKEDWQAIKTNQIQTCLQQNPVNLWELRELALSKGGLMTSEFRQKAWPLLMGFDADETDCVSGEGESQLDHSSPRSVVDAGPLSPEPRARDSEVALIRRDAGRSVIFQYNNYYDDATTPSFAGERLATVLESLVEENNGNLHYYQGLHDVVGVLLHTLDYHTSLTTKLVQKAVAQSHFRDAMRENFGNITWLLSLLLLPLVEQIDVHVHYALHRVDLSTVCLPWVITWFTHDVFHPPTSARLADAFLAGHPLLPLYFSVALLTHPVLKQELMAEQDFDPATVFVILKKLPHAIASDDPTHKSSLQQTVTVQEVLEDALGIMKKYPPRSLLELVDADFDELLHRVSSISSFRTPSAWRITSGKKLTFNAVASQQQRQKQQGREPLFVRAKLATGVPLVQQEISDSSPLLSSQSWGSQRLDRSKRPKWQKYLNRFLRTVKSKLKATQAV
eukprot:scaffold22701_cov123-Cylindrotheca_fusiformis.AAC.14